MADLEKKEAARSDEGVPTPPSPSSEPSRKEEPVDTQALNDTEDADPPRTIHGVKWFLVICALLSALFLYALDNTVVANVQAKVVQTYHRVDLVPWLGVSFALASAATTLPWSKAYGTFSAKKLYLGSTTVFMAASALCGAAPDINSFIVGRAIAGAVTTTNVERPKYLSLTGFIWGIGTVLGPVVGGAISESKATWRWAFYLNLLVGAVVGPIYIILLPDFKPQAGVTLIQRLAQIDYLGTVLSIGAMLCVIMAMNFGGVLWGWDEGESIGLFVAAGVLTILFVLQQVYFIGTSRENRLFPMHFWKSRTMICLFFTMMLATFGSFIGIFYLPLYYQFTRGISAVETSVHLLPFILFLVAFNLLNGQFMGRTGYYYPWYIAGSALELIGGVLLYIVDEHTSNAKIYGYTIILGTGVGCFCQAGFAVAQMKVQPNEIPYSVGFMTVGQMIGIVLGTGMSGALFVNYGQRALAQVFPNVSADVISDALAGVGSGLIDSASPEVRAEAIHGITRAIQLAYVPIIAAGAICLVCSVFMRREKVF
ncbi:major facilitator superfamily domain-containing protein [Colletotrichum godetiae]|uniref:Major facilitator superfamily domain-containing protein n=1 Tax=Colletotrichum godetiae TaxID=1209918 RepID=A0AAJ0ADB1_9PEZI|nr:major facilitator superfamily domain-containing protein [Colletotrichum godetiae]KAK1659527.1 major facilitator superfamily domain-containing protein [Colletotrichum godetiae]